MFIVKFNYQGADFFLRGTIWVDEHNRANKFATEGDASAALERAKKLMRPSMKRLPQVIPANWPAK